MKNIILIVLIVVIIVIIFNSLVVKEGIKNIGYQSCDKYLYTALKLPCVSNGVVTACTHAKTLEGFKKCCSNKNLSTKDKTFCSIAKINNTSTLGDLLTKYGRAMDDINLNSTLFNSRWG